MALSHSISPDKTYSSGKQRTYDEIVAYLQTHWSTGKPSLARAKRLDEALGNPARSLPAILVAGTNGKSITIHMTEQLLRAEGLTVGSLRTPHTLLYNERISLNGLLIDDATFADLANEVINAAEQIGIDAHSQEILTLMALKHFKNKQIDVTLLEVSDTKDEATTQLCKSLVTAVTRIVADETNVDTVMDGIIQEGTWVVTADQSKAHIKRMQELTNKHKGNWAMPIRKIVPLPYPYEQLHGRCGSLAERIAQLYVDHYHNKDAEILNDSLLSRKKTKRGRPTNAVKHLKELKPVPSLEQFWKSIVRNLQGRFEILKKEPTVVLDTASNTDALAQVLLGLRLLHYERHFKGAALIIAAEKDGFANEEFYRLMQAFSRKMHGTVIVCPLEKPVAGTKEEGSWGEKEVATALKSLRVSTRLAKNLDEALTIAHTCVDKKMGLVCIAGSRSIITMYKELNRKK